MENEATKTNEVIQCTCGDTATYMNAYEYMEGIFYCGDCLPLDSNEKDWHFNENGFSKEEAL